MSETKAKAKKKRPLTKDNPARAQRDLSIAKDRLAGLTYRELAKQYGIDQARVCQILQQDEIRAIIEQGTSQMVSMIPLASDVYRTRLSDSGRPELQLKAAQDVAKISGIMPGAVLNQTINNIYQQTNNVITPEAMDLVKKLLPGLDDDIIDVTG